MSTMDDRMKSLKREYPEYIPVGVSFLPATWRRHRDGLRKLVHRFPEIFESFMEVEDYDAVSGTYAAGQHVDAWGCVWSNVAEGMEAIVTGHPVPTREDIRELEAPKVDAGLPHGFMYLRLLDLRGFEEAMIDFAEEPPELQVLIDKVLEYNVRQLRLALNRQPNTPFMAFGDDLGMQHGLAIGAEKWRRYLKPCYEKLYAMCHTAGYHVYMHTDGHILPIIPDLKEAGVDVVNPQVRANGLEELAQVCRGRICVDLDLDRQMFPFASPAEIDAHIREAVEVLGSPEGGLWLKAECAPDVPLENIEAICSALATYRGFYR